MISNHAYISGQADSPDLRGIWNDILFHYQHTNGRLGDKLVIPLLCLFPHWLLAIFNAVMSGGIIVGIWKLIDLSWKPTGISGCGKMTDWLKTAAVPAILISFPWQEDMFLMSYSVNYIWSAAIAVVIAYCFCSSDFLTRLSSKGLMALCIICAFAGAWHECITLTILPGLCIYTFAGKSDLRKKRIILLACMLSGFFTLLFAGGQQERVSSTALSFGISNLLTTRHHIPIPTNDVILHVIYFCLLTITILKSFDRSAFMSLKTSFDAIRHSRFAMMQLLCMSAALSSLLVFSIFGVPRSLSSGIVFVVAGSLSAILHLTCRLPAGNFAILLTKIIIVLISLITFVNFVLSLWVQHHVNESFNEIKSKWSESRSGIVFHDLPVMDRTGHNPWQMMIPDMFVEAWKQYYLSHYLNPGERPKQLIVVPEKLQTLTDLSDNRALDPDAGVYAIGEHLVYTNPQKIDLGINAGDSTAYTSFAMLRFNAVLRNGKQEEIYGFLLPFQPEDPLNGLSYVFPLTTVDKQDANNIVKIDNVVLFPPRNREIANRLR